MYFLRVELLISVYITFYIMGLIEIALNFIGITPIDNLSYGYLITYSFSLGTLLICIFYFGVKINDMY